MNTDQAHAWFRRRQVPGSGCVGGTPSDGVRWELVARTPAPAGFSDLVFTPDGLRPAVLRGIREDEFPQAVALLRDLEREGVLTCPQRFVEWLCSPGPVWGTRTRRSMAGVLLSPDAVSLWLPGKDLRHRIRGMVEPAPLVWSEAGVRELRTGHVSMAGGAW